MFSHITVGADDLDKARLFYDAVLAPIGLVQRDVVPDGGPASLCWVHPEHRFPRFYVYQPFDRKQATAGNGCMAAFLASSPELVTAAHAAGLANGGRDEGAPGPRPHYGPDYFGAYLRDPQGNKIHLVYRSDRC